MAQPNFLALSQHLNGAGHEIALVPNFPMMNINLQLQQLNQQLQQLAEQMAANHAAMNGQIAGLLGQIGVLNGQTAQLIVEQGLLPMRLQNAGSSNNAPLRYPAAFVMVPLAPITKQDLLSINVGACQATAQALGLPALHNPTVAQRRQQIIDHLGVGLTA